MADYLELAVLLGLFIAYIVYCHRPVQVMNATFWLDASPEEASALFKCEPGSGFKYKEIDRVEWIDEERRFVRVTYPNSPIEVHFRNLSVESDGIERTEGGYFDAKRQVFFDSYQSKTAIEEEDGGVIVRYQLTHIRGSLWPFRMMRFLMPFIMQTYRSMVQGALVAKRAEQGRPAPREARLVPSENGKLFKRFGGWPVLLSLLAVAWFIWDLGIWPGLALITTIAVHEGGHLWSMRRHGHKMASAMLVPFFGGVAFSSKEMETDAIDAEVVLMGPVFGLVFALATYAAGLWLANDWLIAAAAMIAFVNGPNLLPIPPLDGGQIAQLMLRRLGERVWKFTSLTLVVVGFGLSYWIGLPVLMVLFALVGIPLAVTKQVVFSRPALGNVELGIVAVSFLLMVWLHIWLILRAIGDDSLDDALATLTRGPF